ncbi:MAG: flagellar hook-associated protein FlgK [Planctomycetota bacterium]|nr:flagellar hook-associated protein FlgK [Planctomycetota bacterium]
MSLLGALNTGQSALAVSQAALQVTGNNIANSGNANYAREVANTTPSLDQQISPGIFVGTGVDLTSVQRQIDQSLTDRLNASISDNEAANTTQTWSGQVEGIFNSLGTNSLQAQVSSFLQNWSGLANAPGNAAQRRIVVQDGQSLAQQFNTYSNQLGALQSSAGDQLTGLAKSATQLAQQVAELNAQIPTSRSGPAGINNGLLDQRDAALKQLSTLVNVKSVDQGNGTINVYIGSEPLVLGTVNRGLKVQQSGINGQPSFKLLFAADNGNVSATSGQLGAVLNAQTQITAVLAQVNNLAAGVIYGLNVLHSSGQGLGGFTSVTATNQVLDSTVALDSTAAGLKFPPVNGSFVVHVKNAQSGLSTSTLVQVNLTGQPSDTTLNSLTSSLNAIPNVTAIIQGGQLQIASTNPNEQITFSQDSSHVLAGLGINTFFQGTDASSMAMNPIVVQKPGFVAAAQNGDTGDNQTALAIANLATVGQPPLGGGSFNSAYRTMIDAIATTSSQAKNDASATLDIRNTLTAQQAATSGVSLDEETVNLMKQQLAYQGAARVISTIATLMQTLLAIM